MDYETLKNILSRISFKPSCVDMGWQWEIEEIYKKNGDVRGWLINTTFSRPDIVTGVIGRGGGRTWPVNTDATLTSVIMTCWLALAQIQDHELREAFCFDGVEVFYPHKTIQQLVYPKELKL